MVYLYTGTQFVASSNYLFQTLKANRWVSEESRCILSLANSFVDGEKPPFPPPPQGKGQIYRKYSVTRTRIFASPSRKQVNLQPHYRGSVATIRQGSKIPNRDLELLVVERSSKEIQDLFWSNTATFSFLNATNTVQGGASNPMVLGMVNFTLYKLYVK